MIGGFPITAEMIRKQMGQSQAEIRSKIMRMPDLTFRRRMLRSADIAASAIRDASDEELVEWFIVSCTEEG